jgi:hypothetical protein
MRILVLLRERLLVDVGCYGLSLNMSCLAIDAVSFAIVNECKCFHRAATIRWYAFATDHEGAGGEAESLRAHS